MADRFDLQGHRGARGLKPENTLPGFEVAIDLEATSIETDVLLTRDAVPILFHSPRVTDQLCRRTPSCPPPYPCHRPLVSSLTLAQMRNFRAECNPDPRRFPDQDTSVTPVAELFAAARGIHPYAPPSLDDLFAFVAAYAGEFGTRAGKTPEQRERAQRLRFDLELKRVPYHPEQVGDEFDGEAPGLLEQRVVEVVRAAGVVDRTAVRSFDHRSVRSVRQLEPGLEGGILVAAMAPVNPADLVRQADAQVYLPLYEYLDAEMVRRLHDAGARVVPWTVNECEDWDRLLNWGVDGIATDFPDALALHLRARGVHGWT